MKKNDCIDIVKPNSFYNKIVHLHVFTYLRKNLLAFKMQQSLSATVEHSQTTQSQEKWIVHIPT